MMTLSRTASSFGVTLLALASAAAPRAQAQFASAESGSATSGTAVAQPQYAILTSTNNTIQATRIPVLYNGKLYYEDLTFSLDFLVNSQGIVSVDVTPTLATSANPSTGGFKAGTYIGPSNVNGGKSIIVVSGPSTLPGGGTAWSLAASNTASQYTYPSTATWYVEAPANTPLAARIKAAGITTTQYSFGTGDSGGDWANNSLLGFNQVGNTLVVTDFTTCCQDSSTPTDTITYTLQP